jgi:hypothetical protein
VTYSLNSHWSRFSLASDNWYKFLPTILSSVSLALTLMSNSWCQFVQVVWFPNDGTGPPMSQNFGIWTYETLLTSSRTGNPYEACVSYDSSSSRPPPFERDSHWRSAMAFSALTSIMGGLLCVGLWLSPCCYPSHLLSSTWKCMGVGLVLVTLCQGLTLLFLASPICVPSELTTSEGTPASSTGCDTIWGANMSIAAVVLWFLSGMAAMFISPPNCRRDRPLVTHTVTYTQTTMPDGTRVLQEQTTVVPGIPTNKPEEAV